MLLGVLSCEKSQIQTEPVKEVTLKKNEAVVANSSSSDVALLDLLYDKVEGESSVPAANSLDVVKITEFLDFGCAYCYNFKKILEKVMASFRDKLEVETIIVSWRGENLPKFFYYAQKKGKGEEVKSMLFGLYHDSNVKNIGNPDILQTVGEEIGLFGSDVKVEDVINDPEIVEMYKKSEEKVRKFKVKGTPTVIVEDSMKINWAEENLTNVINYLLK